MARLGGIGFIYSRPGALATIPWTLERFVTRNKGDLIAGVCLAAFGVYVISVAAKLPYVSDVGPGPGFFPLWLGIGMVLGACCLVFAFLERSANASNNQPQSWKSSGRALTGWLAIIVAISLLGRIGFALSFVILAIFLNVALDRRPALPAVAVGVGLAVAFHLIFTIALDVSLPKGVWGF